MNEETAGFAYFWEYIVKEEHIDQFCRIYGPKGKWADLFQRSEGYLGTELHRDMTNSLRFITVDYWTSREACDRFRQQVKPEFEALDAYCEGLTLEERFLGDFNLQA